MGSRCLQRPQQTAFQAKQSCWLQSSLLFWQCLELSMGCTVCLAQPPAEQHALLQTLQVQCCVTEKRECSNGHRSVQCNMGHVVPPMTTAFPAQCLQTAAAESSICRAQAHVQDKHRAAPDVKWKVASYTRNCMQWCLLNLQTDARVDQHAGCTARCLLDRRQHNRCQPHLFSIVQCLHHSHGRCVPRCLAKDFPDQQKLLTVVQPLLLAVL